MESLAIYGAKITLKIPKTQRQPLFQALILVPVHWSFAPAWCSAKASPRDFWWIWDFGSPRPPIEGAPDPEHGVYTTAIQTFQLNGPLDYSGDNGYVWVVATRQDIGCVGEANAYKITAEAKDGDTTVITVRAGVLRDNVTGELLVSCWEINPPPAGD